ncbi:MAG: ABC transporter substrate-binding protein [Ruminococcus sp.]|nr:ABC transporter substrate-binding protein [Ruminococcus sp.]
MKKTFKAIISVLLVAVIVVACFTACTNNANNGEKVYKVGICQLTQHEALDAATNGFRDALTEKLGDKVVFDEQNASGESTNCTTIVSKFVSDKVDLILANATPALTAATEATNTIPIVGTSITDYATALAISDWSGKTGINVTGTADLAPLKDQAAMIKELVPNAKTVGILYCSAEPNSKYQSDIVKSELEALGYEVKVYTFVDSNDVLAVTQSAVQNCQALYIPTDNTAASNTELINSVTEPAKVPIVAGEEGICKGCGVATLSISYYDIGYKAGLMAYEILVNGANPADMEIAYADSTTKKYMADRAAAIGVTIPDGYEAITVSAK